jgi:hypothetical protein
MSDENSRRGVAFADEETRERVAKAGGQARAQDKEGVAVRSWPQGWRDGCGGKRSRVL